MSLDSIKYQNIMQYYNIPFYSMDSYLLVFVLIWFIFLSRSDKICLLILIFLWYQSRVSPSCANSSMDFFSLILSLWLHLQSFAFYELIQVVQHLHILESYLDILHWAFHILSMNEITLEMTAESFWFPRRPMLSRNVGSKPRILPVNCGLHWLADLAQLLPQAMIGLTNWKEVNGPSFDWLIS